MSAPRPVSIYRSGEWNVGENPADLVDLGFHGGSRDKFAPACLYRFLPLGHRHIEVRLHVRECGGAHRRIAQAFDQEFGSAFITTPLLRDAHA